MGDVKSVIANEIIKNDIFRDDCNILFFEKDDGFKRYQGVSTVDQDPELHLVFSIPTTGKNIYVTVSDGYTQLIRQVFATLEDIESDGGIVQLGNVQLFNNGDFKEKGVEGIILLSVKTSNVLNYLPSEIEIDSAVYKFLLVTFITKEEYLIWKKEGMMN